MKRFSAAAAALLLAVSSSFAAWDYFPVIEEGSVEANINCGHNIKIRYGITENWEIFSTNNVDLLGLGEGQSYGIGGRYQVIPEMLGVYMNLGFRSADDPRGAAGSWGLVPGVTFSTEFTEAVSFGAGMGLGMEFGAVTDGSKPDDRGVMMHLGLGLEIDFALNDNVSLWAGLDFEYDNLNQENRADLEMKEALTPMFGAVFSVGNLSVGTTIGLRLDATNQDGDDSVGLWGGVDFSIKF
ncbi:MAG: hypothetical protein FWE57_08560 [Chitinispirillia bacterium]|nr:hypothetical protein [Chitinispirillia bacterium]